MRRRVLVLALGLILLASARALAGAALVIEDFGAVADTSPASAPTANGPDVTPAFNAAIQAACQPGAPRVLRFRVGQYAFRTPPEPIPCAVMLVGQGAGSTMLVRDYSSGFFLQWVGGVEGGGGTEDLAVFAWIGTTGGIGLYVRSQASSPPGTIAGANEFRNTIVSGFGTWTYSVYFDGSQRGDCTAACGVRSIRLDNVRLFQSTDFNLVCYNCVAVEWFGGGSYGVAPGVWFGGPVVTGNYLNADLQGGATGPGVLVGR